MSASLAGKSRCKTGKTVVGQPVSSLASSEITFSSWRAFFAVNVQFHRLGPMII